MDASTDQRISPELRQHPAAFVAEAAPEAMVLLDPDLRIRYLNPACTRLFGYDPGSIIGDPVLDHVHFEDLGLARGAANEAHRNEGEHAAVRVRLRHRCGDWIDAVITSNTVARPDGVWMVVCARPLDVGEGVIERRRRLEAVLREASVTCSGMHWYEIDATVADLLGRVAEVVHARRVEVAWEDADGEGARRIAVWSAPGWEVEEQGVGTPFARIPGAAWAAEDVCRFVDDPALLAASVEVGPVVELGAVSAAEVPVPATTGARAVMRLLFDVRKGPWDDANADVVAMIGATIISAARRCWAEERTSIRARSDELTGIANRAALFDALEVALDEQAPGAEVGVVFIDVDNLKSVNDRLGHAGGDILLMSIADALVRSVRDGDLVARMGGDEFVVLCRGIGSVAMLDRVRLRVDRAVNGLRVGDALSEASVGAVCAATGETAGALLDRADRAMYAEKRRRKGLL